jgi:hypothetical protein
MAAFGDKAQLLAHWNSIIIIIFFFVHLCMGDSACFVDSKLYCISRAYEV